MHQLIWSIHHVVIDGWCLSVLLHEVLDIYESIRRGRRARIETESGRFAITSPGCAIGTTQRPKEYWRQALRGVTAATPLGLRGSVAGRRGAIAPEASPSVRPRLRADVTASAPGAGAIASAHAEHPDPGRMGSAAVPVQRPERRPLRRHGLRAAARAVGRGVDGRDVHQLAAAPRRGDEEADLVPWLRELQATMVELRRFEAIPLSRIQAWSEVPPGMPLFESIVIVQNLPFVASLQERANRLGIESARYLERTHYPLAVTVLPGTELGIKIGFDTRPIRSRRPSSGRSGTSGPCSRRWPSTPSGDSSTCP